MGVLYQAAQCPAVMAPTAAYTKAGAYAGSSSPPVSYGLVTGPNPIVAPWNANAMGQDLLARYGGGGYAVAKGLDLSAPAAGLNLNVAAGHAIVDGVVEIAAATTVAIPPNSAPAWVWLTNAGALVLTQGFGAGGLTPPSPSCCLLGSVTSDPTRITGVDTSGVVYIRGGMMWRQTADIAAPGDTPPSTVQFFARTVAGLYLWDGTTYGRLDDTTAGALLQIEDLQSQLDQVSALVRNIYAYNVTRLGLDPRPEYEEELVMGIAENM